MAAKRPEDLFLSPFVFTDVTEKQILPLASLAAG